MTRSPEKPVGTADDPTATYLTEDREDVRSFRISCAAAFALHLIFLCTAIPTWQTTEAEPAQRPEALRIMATPRFKVEPPKPEQTRQRREMLKSVPVPDPSPDDDPYLVDLKPEIELTFEDDVFLGLPQAPPPSPVPEPEITEPVRVGGGLASPQRTHYVEPRYPGLAKRSRIDGTVVLEATIDTEGRVVDLTVVAGRPLGLSEAAVEAVSQWRFEPSRLNGKRVPVLYRLEVVFALR